MVGAILTKVVVIKSSKVAKTKGVQGSTYSPSWTTKDKEVASKT